MKMWVKAGESEQSRKVTHQVLLHWNRSVFASFGLSLGMQVQRTSVTLEQVRRRRKR